VLVEPQDAPYLSMLKLDYLRLMTFPFTEVVVRLRSGEFFVTREAPATPDWRQFYDYKLGRENMLATYGQLSDDTKKALHVSTVRQVMDDLEFRSQPSA